MTSIQKAWTEVQNRVGAAARRVHRDPSEIRIIAVSKRQGARAIAEGFQAGIRCFGESYVQEALGKMQSPEFRNFSSEMEWHFIGALQSNKARKVVPAFSWVHSVDRWSLARELDRVSKEQGKVVRILLELNVANERTKSGVSESEIFDLASRISHETQLEVAGIMSFPPYCEKAEDSRIHFRRTREIAQELQARHLLRCPCTELSMGVTSDYEVAVEEGSTMVRIGTAIFGSRTT